VSNQPPDTPFKLLSYTQWPAVATIEGAYIQPEHLPRPAGSTISTTAEYGNVVVAVTWYLFPRMMVASDGALNTSIINTATSPPSADLAHRVLREFADFIACPPLLGEE
jgi:hypothetical protein